MPASIGNITLDVKDDVLKQAVVKVKLSHAKQWRVRLAIAKWLMVLAAWIAWLDIEFEFGEPCCADESCECECST